MAEREVFIDTNVFTGIVENIQNAAASCILSDGLLGNLKVMEGTDTGRKMNAILKKIYQTQDAYRHETSDSLPRALLTLRDSMIEQDKILGDSLTVEKIGGKR
ncbi:MAG: hypothetical protein J5504_07235 [Butyrivibrio sp.]|nr:hypothetical protein [Butyrivibrio sp.]